MFQVLHLAARNGQAEKARLLLENEISVHQTQTSGWNCLHLAVRYGQPDTISTLLEYGIDIDAENQGWTALQLAALNGHMDIVSILLNKGANSSILNRDRKTALDIARDEGHDKIAAIIIETEFQGNNPDLLPSPPPTPPSAPPLEMFGSQSPAGAEGGGGGGGCLDTFDQWKIKLQKDLENISNDSSSTGGGGSEAGGRGEGEEVTITWKSFEEEKLELLQQLEAARLKEVTRISEEIQKREDKWLVTVGRTERQAELLRSQIENMQSNKPTAEESRRMKYKTLKEDITQISALIESSRAQTELIEHLQSLQILSEFCSASREKREVLEQLAGLQVRERRELEAIKREKYQEIELAEAEVGREVERLGKRIRILEEELELLETERVKKERRHKEVLVGLKEELVKAEK